MPDRAQRHLFCSAIDQDFSVVAPAGVGKTSALVERIVQIVRQRPEDLACLYVLSYTNAAAASLEERVRDRVNQELPTQKQRTYLDQCFFGTIHSLCWRLIQQWDSNTYTLVCNDSALKAAFVDSLDASDPTWTQFRQVFRLFDVRQLMRCVSSYGLLDPQFINGSMVPESDKEEAEATACCQKLSERYFQFCHEQGYLTYEDYSVWADACIQTPQAKAYYQTHPVKVLLDEAQDTDPLQFQFLEHWRQLNPDNQFSMVGDPQQSIYNERAEVQTYWAYHQELVRQNVCQELTFNQTFRCAPTIVQALNARLPEVLSSKRDPQQVDYVPLSTASIQKGTFGPIALPDTSDQQDKNKLEASCIDAFLRQHLKQHPGPLASVCLLVPRKAWLVVLQRALEGLGWKVQLHSTEETGRHNPLFCVCLALIHCINFPDDTFEFNGLLHVLFRCPDEDLAYLAHQPDAVSPMTQKQVALLKSWIQMAAQQPLCAGLASLISELQAYCPPADYNNHCIDSIWAAAFDCQKQNQSWMALEERLQDELDQEIPLNLAVDADALQGFTVHKAKGLEWDSIILPFFYRPYGEPNRTYPYRYHHHCILNKELKASVDVAGDSKRNLQRLLYVALTRAKRHCHWINDASLWKKGLSLGSLWESGAAHLIP